MNTNWFVFTTLKMLKSQWEKYDKNKFNLKGGKVHKMKRQLENLNKGKDKKFFYFHNIGKI